MKKLSLKLKKINIFKKRKKDKKNKFEGNNILPYQIKNEKFKPIGPK
jgi:hypothetical protein